jgi:hypothetical protein
MRCGAPMPKLKATKPRGTKKEPTLLMGLKYSNATI